MAGKGESMTRKGERERERENDEEGTKT